MKNTFLLSVAISLFMTIGCQEQALRESSGFTPLDSLQRQIAGFAAESGGEVGVAAKNFATGLEVRYRDSARYPMQSTFKFPIAMAVLHQVDEGRLLLEQPIYLDRKWMVPNTWSPLRDSFPKGNVNVPLSKLLTLMVSQSDNIACDILIDLIGNEAMINDYIHKLGVKDLAIVANEAKMHAGWEVQYSNWCHHCEDQQSALRF
ncbi:class A beta-lactamase-related serine hydrolase [Chitinophaga pendula]|uniref:serine hydrolase n=1 Tax=Chitinophaga TaxID=79328 RepID=UPI000BB069F4|nr:MULTISPECIES: serine hydrolase [Chitinophaga]ASZ12560.1 hypothetical protein CK934_17140 [Chitinophaga sp. MD30]UCJ09838.1 class A beta-lactamase-related serine hydrolase [Chitinophaga pendula]